MNLLLWSIIVSFGNMLSIKCIPKILSWYLDNSKENRNVEAEISLLKREQSDISMVKEFARYARLQRKINKLNEQLKNNIRENASKNLKIKLTWNVLLYVFSGILHLVFVYYNYRRTVLHELPSDLFSPISWLVRWPSSQVDTMSFLFWYSITNCVAKVTTSNLL